MQNLTFSDSPCDKTFSMTNPAYKFPLKKPMLCPLCGAYEDGIVISSHLDDKEDNKKFGTVNYKCTHCQGNYLVVYYLDPDTRTSEFGGFHPSISMNYKNELLESTSPRFITSYNQALRAELGGDIELAAIGYRQALECLVKDYAIIERDADREKVANQSLFSVIGEYLGETELIATADVIRILGNDYAHYERRYPELDFELLKRYMEIFIRLVETKLLTSHPPVSR